MLPWRHNLDCSRRSLVTFCQCSTRRSLGMTEKNTFSAQFSTEWQGKIILTSERISFSHVKVKVCTTCNFQRRRNYNFSVKHGRRTLYHLNAEVLRMKFSHLKLLATKYMFNLQKEWILWREEKKFGVISRDSFLHKTWSNVFHTWLFHDTCLFLNVTFIFSQYHMYIFKVCANLHEISSKSTWALAKI